MVTNMYKYFSGCTANALHWLRRKATRILVCSITENAGQAHWTSRLIHFENQKAILITATEAILIFAIKMVASNASERPARTTCIS